jgi:cobaltochelatase CobN
VAALLFYRALVASGGTQAVDAMIVGLQDCGLNPLPLYVQSLKNPFAIEVIGGLFAAAPPEVILNATAFATTAPGRKHAGGPLSQADAPILQVVFAGIGRAAWAESARGLTARDLLPLSLRPIGPTCAARHPPTARWH